jgi:phosphatidyl-N-methylethanolamine N-methyltransferase
MGGLNAINWNPIVVILAASLIICGQYLNYSVFQSLGKVGVFYGNVYGYQTPWVTAFQYLGVMMSIFGLFVLWSNHPLWYILPLVEVLLYNCESIFEFKLIKRKLDKM